MSKNPNTSMLIETPDGKIFLTKKINSSSIEQFSQTFNVKISLIAIEAKDKNLILSPDLFIKAFCSQSQTNLKADDFKVIEILYHPKCFSKERKNEIKKISNEIQSKIKSSFLSGETIGLQTLVDKFKKYKLSQPTIGKYFNQVKSDLKKDGYQFQKNNNKFLAFKDYKEAY